MASIPHLRADIETIKSIYKSDPVARTIFDDLGRRQRSAPETSVDRLLAILENKGHTASKTDVIQFLQALEKAGCGSFIRGRRGHPSRFKWSDNFIDLGRAAAGHAINEEAITEIDEDEIVSFFTSQGYAPEEHVLTHKFMLRPDFPLFLRLPADLSTSEASRLAEFIKTLPFS